MWRIQKTVTKEYPVHRQPGWSRLTCSYTDPMGSDQDVHIIYKLWQICIIPCRKRSSHELHDAIKKNYMVQFKKRWWGNTCCNSLVLECLYCIAYNFHNSGNKVVKKEQYSDKKKFLAHGNHVRYSSHEWSGIWCDICIEQTLMEAVKSEGGLSRGRIRNSFSSHKCWVLTLSYFLTSTCGWWKISVNMLHSIETFLRHKWSEMLRQLNMP